jgi:hypothetical protein
MMILLRRLHQTSWASDSVTRATALVLGALLMTVSGIGCSSEVSSKVDASREALSFDAKQACEDGQCPCDSPLGSVAHGTSVTVYSTENIACSDSCEKYATQVKCENGKFSQDISQSFFLCRVAECASCSLGSNLIRHGEVVETYKTNETDCNESCEDVKTTRKCENGVLTGDQASTHLTCSTRQCRCRLPDESGYLSLGGRTTFYSSVKAACGTTCDALKASRSCVSTGSGASRSFVFDGLESFKFQTCEEASDCECILPNGLGVIKNGETTTLDNVAQVPCGQTCPSSARIQVRCENGKLRNTATLSLIDNLTSYKYRCSAADCQLCAKGDGTFVSTGTSVLFYKTSSPACGVSCQAPTVGVLRKCNNGVFEGDTTFDKPTCAERAPCKCAFPDNPLQFVEVNQSQVFYSSNRALCDRACSALSQSRTCVESLVNGVYKYELNGDPSYRHSTCGSPIGCSCRLPGNMGSIINGKTIRLSAVAQVQCGQTCDSVDSIQVVCQDGTLKMASTGSVVDIEQADFRYRYTCQVPFCPDCPLRGFGAIQNGSSVKLCSKQKLICGDRQELFVSEFACENGVLKRNGQPYAAESDPNAPANWFNECPLDCPGCPTPWGDIVNEGGAVNAYQLMNAVSNTCGRGCKMQKRTCKNGKLDGDDSFNLKACLANSCNEEGGGAPPRLCLFPWQNSYVTPDAQIPVWSRREVACGDSCQNYFRLARCNFKTGFFDVGPEYIYQSCTEVCPR